MDETSRNLEPCISHGDHPLRQMTRLPLLREAHQRGRWLRRAHPRSGCVIVAAGGGSIKKPALTYESYGIGPPPLPGLVSWILVAELPGVALSNSCRKVVSRPRAGVSRASKVIT